MLAKNEVPGVQVSSYKRNRHVTISRTTGGHYQVTERGYQEETFHLPEHDLPKLLKRLFKREFPRSRKLRVIKLSADQKIGRTDLKTI
ncbi:MAG: hypothetical protein D6B25_18745 [Desulfobulbaceae bacterium]|nr:MAG: hypothetical protein D6B25_18745 [Desulfobulbaceae bacterium]